MGLSSITVQQREKEDEALKSLIAFSLVGSVGLHVAVLSTSNLWVKEKKLAEKPIEVVVLDTPPKVEAAPETKPLPKIGDGSKPLASAKSSPAPTAKLAPQQEAPSKVQKPISSKTTNIEKPVATPKVAEIPPTPIATPTPKVTETLPPIPTPSPEVVQTPTPIASLPSDLIAKLKSTPTPTPKSVVTPPQASQPQSVQRAPVNATPPSPVAAKPPAQNNRLPVRSPNSAISNALQRPTAASQNSPTNSDRSLSPNSQNSAGNNSNLANNFGSSRVGSNNNNSSDRPSNNKIATAPSNNPNPASEDLLSPGVGSGGLACRRCPHPAYPKRAERRGLEGTVQVVFDADRNGNISNVRVANSSGHDILDRAATQAVKGWKLASSNSEQQGITQSITFAKKGSDTESQARERRARQQQERLAREKEQQERLTRERQQQERLAREKEQQQRQQQEIFNQNVPQPSTPPANFPEPLPTSTPIESDLTAPQP